MTPQTQPPQSPQQHQQTLTYQPHSQPQQELHLARDADRGIRLSELDIPFADYAIIILRVGDQTRMQGSISGGTNVFWATVGGVVIGSDSASALANLTSAPINETALALHLVDSLSTGALGDSTMWNGVRAVPPMSWLQLDPIHSPAVFRWWNPPESTRSIAEAAPELEGLILASLEMHCNAEGLVSADLSGGLDSSSLVYALAELGASPTTFHSSSANRWNDDLSWARRVSSDTGFELITLGNFADHSRAFDVTSQTQPTALDSPPSWSASRYIGMSRSLTSDSPPSWGASGWFLVWQVFSARLSTELGCLTGLPGAAGVGSGAR